jgi:4'-phosphopantetheinyl transferase EntD
VIASLLPPGVACAELFDDPPAEIAGFPAELAAVARAVDKRRREFLTVRHCARQALATLGVAPVPILPGDRGAPRWPAGVIGSMTHCDGYRGAAVARVGVVRSIGIDAEPHEPLPDGVADLVVRPEEAALVETLARADGGICWDRLLFSVKESVYKAWYPLARRWLDFAEASVTLEPQGRFQVRLLVEPPTVEGARLDGFTGRWLVRDGLVVTAITW